MEYTLIEEYLDGTLSPEARAAFEAQMAADPNLARELRLSEAARAAVQIQALLDRNSALQHRGLQKLRWRKWWWKTLDTLENLFVRRDTDGNSTIRWGSVAGMVAGVALLLFVVMRSGIFTTIPAASPKPLAVPKEKAIIAFNAYYKRIDLSGTLGGADLDTLYRFARIQYAEGECADALPALDALLADEKFESRPMAFLLKGTCQLESGEAAAALETLRQVPSTAAGLYQDAEWYRALAHLKLEKTEEASALLRDLAENPKHRHSKDAAALLETE